MRAAKSTGLLSGFIDRRLERYKDEFLSILKREVETATRDQSQRVIDSVRGEAQRIIDTMHGLFLDQYHNVLVSGHRTAARESADFALQNMPKARIFSHKHDTLRYALSLAPSGVLALEFGVAVGTTLKIIAEDRKGRGAIFGFDSFEGLPETWRSGVHKGAFAVNELPVVDGAELVVGLFDDTLAGFLAEHPGPVDFLHLDADIYSSTKTVIDLVGPRLREGSIVIFDEFFNYPGWQQHEYLAWKEFMDRTGLRCVYEAYTFNDEQVVARVLG